MCCIRGILNKPNVFMFCLKCLSDRPPGTSRCRQDSKTVKMQYINCVDSVPTVPYCQRISGFSRRPAAFAANPVGSSAAALNTARRSELIRYTRRWFAIAGDRGWLSTPSQDISGRPLRSAAESFCKSSSNLQVAGLSST